MNDDYNYINNKYNYKQSESIENTTSRNSKISKYNIYKTDDDENKFINSIKKRKNIDSSE